ncbi:uncharacterized protein LOC124914676 [Impatiens glandulifera]|uniref:uncharacterized protein LOC124914676 n=1 Tax=Impatiens glandulifera TaxID=253017 RepID=UPI001FB18ED4|nr:uncharacterized protein LOC124914676 [Impatiens glandulifera]
MEIIPLLGQCNSSSMAIFIFLSLLLFGVHPKVVAGLEINPLVELSSRDDLARMAGYGEEKLSTVMIYGSVLCSPCSDEKAQDQAQPISGASVVVSCRTNKKASKSNWVEGSTDKYGEFLIDLPSHLHSIPDLDKRCCVKVTKVPKNSICHHHRSFTGKHSELEKSASSDGNGGIRSYTAKKLVLAPNHSHEECTNNTSL